MHPSKQRRITRWEHEAVIEAMQRRLDERPNAMRVRRSIVEHVFGTIKDWMGRSHFLTRKLANVATEMSLHVLAYNVKTGSRRPRHSCTDRSDPRMRQGSVFFVRTAE